MIFDAIATSCITKDHEIKSKWGRSPMLHFKAGKMMIISAEDYLIIIKQYEEYRNIKVDHDRDYRKHNKFVKNNNNFVDQPGDDRVVQWTNL